MHQTTEMKAANHGNILACEQPQHLANEEKVTRVISVKKEKRKKFIEEAGIVNKI